MKDQSSVLTIYIVEEKYKNKPRASGKGSGDEGEDDDEDSSSDEDEDDEGFLVTEALDAQISATLQAIRNKDPRVYDEKATFFEPIEEGDAVDGDAQKKEKPMYLRDYHRENLLKGTIGAEDNEVTLPVRTYAQEQADLQKSIVTEMHAAADAEMEDAAENGDEAMDDDFLVPKPKSSSANQAPHPSRAANVEVDVKLAEKDPETFLSNFMAARAWVAADRRADLKPFESDDDEEVERAEKFEAAYNLRFEDPEGSNQVLRTFARDIVAAKSVRRDELKGRKKQREVERERREAEKQERDEEKARLRKLQIEQLETKLQKIKKAAGLRGKALKDEEWMKVLEEDWEDDKWEEQMKRRFGDDYYAEVEAGSEADSDDADDENADQKKKKKAKKPKWDDDIDITDIVPEFADEEETTKKPSFTVSDSEPEVESEDEADGTAHKPKSSKDRLKEKQEQRKAARLQRKKIEEMVDSHMDVDLAMLPRATKKATPFRYRETSPTSFGLTARDILMAPDTALNQFAGLKKLAPFRDAERKRKDKRHLGKKARLREWRRETFGNEDGPEVVLAPATAGTEGAADHADGNVVEGKRKKKRSKKSKGGAQAA